MERQTYWDKELQCWSLHCSSSYAAEILAQYENLLFDKNDKEYMSMEQLKKVINSEIGGVVLNFNEMTYKEHSEMLMLHMGWILGNIGGLKDIVNGKRHDE